MGKPIIWSNGLGVQSTAIALLIHEGRLPKPNRIICADTSREFSKSRIYHDEHIAPLLAEIGLKTDFASHDLATVDLYSKKQHDVLLPAYTEKGRLPTFCSGEWKRNVVRRYIGGYQNNKNGIVMWIGYSLDEIGRLKESGVDWIENYFPLCYDVKMTRNECKEYIKSRGLPVPSQSRCWGCPHQEDNEWIEVQNSPEEWEKACKLDDQIYQSHGVRLHSSRQPLKTIKFVPRTQKASGFLFDCDSGMCGI